MRFKSVIFYIHLFSIAHATITDMPSQQSARDRTVNRKIHRLNWDAFLVQKWSLYLTYLMRVPAYVIQHALVPLFIAYSLQAIIERQFTDVPGLVAIIIGLSLAQVIMMGVGAWAVSNNAVVAAAAIQNRVFKNYLAKDYEFYSNNFMGALSANAIRLREASTEYGLVFTLDIPKQIVTVFAGLLVIGWQAPLLALITFACMAALFTYTIAMSRWRLKFRRKLSQAGSELAGALTDSIGQAQMVKSFAAETYEQSHIEASLSPWQKAQKTVWLTSIPADAGRYMFMAIAIGILLLSTAHLYQQGTIPIAIVALVQLYVIKMITTVSDIADLIKRYETIMGSVYAAVQTMEVPSTIVDPAKPKKLPKKTDNLTITFANASFWYSDVQENHPALKDISLTIAPGEKIGIVGYSGSGKTTLTKLLLRFMDVRKGSISIGGIDLRKAKQKDVRDIIAYVPQEPLLFHRSIYDNIHYGNPRASKRTVLQAAKMGHVDEFVRQLPEKYDTLVGERGIKLSGGQRQRIAIARAIVKDAPILVLDEATSALDSKSEKLIQDALWDLMKNRTAVVVAHRLSTIQRMDRIVVMDKGRVVQLGTHAELLEQKGSIYANLWAHQSGGYIVEAPSE